MIFFCTDGNSIIGSGHIMRCLSIADAVREIGEDCVFLTTSNDMEDIINNRSYINIVLDDRYDELKSEAVIKILDAFNSPTVFVDSYFVSAEYLNQLRIYCHNHGGILVYIDDLKSFAYPCDILINYQVHGSRKEYDTIYLGNKSPEFLIGMDYVPLRKQFMNLSPRIVRKKVNDILVSTGGADPEHVSMELVKQAKLRDKVFHFVIGALNKDKLQIVKEAEDCTNIIIHENVSDMSKLMQTCDIAISAAGSTLYELCATQTPALSYVIADNQIQIADGFSLRKIIKNCGNVNQDGVKTVSKTLMKEVDALCESYVERESIAKKMKNVVDGFGAKRIVKRVLNCK